MSARKPRTVFRRRERLARPSACSACRGTRLDPPVIALGRGASGEGGG